MRRMAARTGQGSHIGSRAEQQDCAACFVSADARCHLLVVADGMGGRSGGARAARAVIQSAEAHWQGAGRLPDNPPAFLQSLCQHAHAAIGQFAEDSGEPAGTTVVALLCGPERAWWVHAGDSRLYAFRAGRPVFRTDDHTIVQQRVRRGQLDETAAALHPDQHKLLRGLGGRDPLQLTHGQMRVDADTGFVLCTDGFWAHVSSDEMAGLLAAADPDQACAQWAAVAAERAGAGADNATVAVLQPAGSPSHGFWRPLWPLIAAVALALAAFVWLAIRS